MRDKHAGDQQGPACALQHGLWGTVAYRAGRWCHKGRWTHGKCTTMLNRAPLTPSKAGYGLGGLGRGESVLECGAGCTKPVRHN